MRMEHVALGRRRGWARIEAVVACLAGIAIFALTAAALFLIGVVAVARAWSWATSSDLLDLPIWDLAPGGAGAFGAGAVVISFAGAFWYFWRGAEPQILAEIGARPLAEAGAEQVHNVVEALSIGLGVSPPRVYFCDDPVPNAVSARSRRSRSLCLTTGCASLSRDELEALCAHELAHLQARDAQWVTAGLVALARARRFGSRVWALGLALFVVVGAAYHYLDLVLGSTALIAVALVALGTLSRSVLRRLELAVRHHADEIADVAAIQLARNPQSLGVLCARLAENEGRVRHAGWRSELLWFEAVEDLAEVAGPEVGIRDSDQIAAAVGAAARTKQALIERAVAAYAEARLPLPASVQALR
jgi:Zn-dependent protease with chaperone function